MPSNAISNEGLIIFEVEDKKPNKKVEINGIDVSSDVSNLNFTDVSKDGIGNFSVNLNNYKGKYNSLKAGNPVLIYLDNSDGTLLQFRGKIDKSIPSLSGIYEIDVTGRKAPELVDIDNLTIAFDEEPVGTAFESAITAINDGAGYTVVTFSTSPNSNITITRNFRDTSGITILRFIAQKAGWEFRIQNDEVYTIEIIDKNSPPKSQEIIAIGVNVISAPGITKDSTYVKNHITVLGDNIEGVLVLWTIGDPPFIPWKKTLHINDTTCQTRQQCIDRAQLEFNELSEEKLHGSVDTIGLENLRPGYLLEVNIPYVLVGEFIIKSFNHNYNSSGWDTSITFEQSPEIPNTLIKKNTERIKEREQLQNPNRMLFSEVFTFDDDSKTESSSGVIIENGKLKLISGIDTGTWISKPIAAASEIQSGEIRQNGNDDLDLSEFEMAADNENFETIIPGTKGNPGTNHNFTNKGKNIKVRITLKSDSDNPNPELEALSELWRT